MGTIEGHNSIDGQGGHILSKLPYCATDLTSREECVEALPNRRHSIQEAQIHAHPQEEGHGCHTQGVCRRGAVARRWVRKRNRGREGPLIRSLEEGQMWDDGTEVGAAGGDVAAEAEAMGSTPRLPRTTVAAARAVVMKGDQQGERHALDASIHTEEEEEENTVRTSLEDTARKGVHSLSLLDVPGLHMQQETRSAFAAVVVLEVSLDVARGLHLVLSLLQMKIGGSAVEVAAARDPVKRTPGFQ